MMKSWVHIRTEDQVPEGRLKRTVLPCKSGNLARPRSGCVCPGEIADRRSAVATTNVDQATYVTGRHLFSRPYGTSLRDWSVPRISSWAIFSRPFGTQREFFR